MLAYALRRLLLAVPPLIGITFVSFLVIHLAPGDPAEMQTGDLSVEAKRAYEQLRVEFGLDKPLPVQYWNWLMRLVRLDFGKSMADIENRHAARSQAADHFEQSIAFARR